MAFDYTYYSVKDCGYYEFMPGRWLAGKLIENGYFTWSQEAVNAAVNVQLNDESDIIVATYPKTGREIVLPHVILGQYKIN